LQLLVTVALIFFMFYPEGIIGKHTKVLAPIVVLTGTSMAFVMVSCLVAAALTAIYYVLWSGSVSCSYKTLPRVTSMCGMCSDVH